MKALPLSAHLRSLCLASTAIAAVSCPAQAQPASDIVELSVPATDAERIAEQVARSVVQVVATAYGTTPANGLLNLQRVVGAGTIVDEAGYILTNAAVVRAAMEIDVLLPEKAADGSDAVREVPATVVGVIADLDLAVLRVQANHLPALPMARRRVRLGERTLSVIPGPSGSHGVAVGVVLATGASIQESSPVPYLITDAPSGVAGSPVVNGDGELVGLAAAFTGESNAQASAALPVALLHAALEQAQSGTPWRRGVVGLIAESVAYTSPQDHTGAQPAQLVVSKVATGLPAERVGLRAGDVIVAVNHQPVQGMELATLYLALYTLREGQTLTLDVERGRERLELAPIAVPAIDVLAAQ